MNLLDLQKPFPVEDIEWRIQSSGVKASKPWGKVLAYVTSRAIQTRLDEVCGPDRWKNEFAAGPQGGVLCGISILCRLVEDGHPHWITKWDGAENTDFEAIKGGLSGAEKRAGVQWGIGRYLYKLDIGWADFSDKGKNYINIKDKSGKSLGNFHWDPPELPIWALPEDEKPLDTIQAIKDMSNLPKGMMTESERNEKADILLVETDNVKFLKAMEDMLDKIHPGKELEILKDYMPDPFCEVNVKYIVDRDKQLEAHKDLKEFLDKQS